MPFLPPNQQCQSTEGKHKHKSLIHKKTSYKSTTSSEKHSQTLSPPGHQKCLCAVKVGLTPYLKVSLHSVLLCMVIQKVSALETCVHGKTCSTFFTGTKLLAPLSVSYETCTSHCCVSYWHCPHGAGSVKRTVSVRLSVPAWATVANLLLQVCCCGPSRQEIMIDCCSSSGRMRAVPRCQHTY